MTVAFSLILTGYCLLMLILLLGWSMMRKMKISGLGKVKSGISIVVACRNEEENIENLVRSLSALHYPLDQYEVILVNDHSSDKTGTFMGSSTQNISNIILLHLPEGEEGKKRALQFGIRHSKFDLIATTDADCRVPADWLSYVSLYFENSETKMLAGAVRFSGTRNFFSRLQSMEFSSLIGTAAAAIGLGHPVMSNGANLAFRKEVFDKVGGYDDNVHVPSGDDEFLMRKIFSLYPKGIVFMNFPESTVSAQPQQSIRNFFYQRLRWAGKWKHNTDVMTKVLAVFILLSQIAFISLVLRDIFYPDLSVFILALKILLESVFLFAARRFLGMQFDWLAFLVLQIIYPFYVIVIGLFSISGSYRWKQRNYK